MHPHTNWGDIFFDLFYVAAAYNLGNLLRQAYAAIGLLYAAGLFFPIQNLWAYKMMYDSRYYFADDVWHRGYELAVLMALATAVSNIRSVDILAHAADSIDLFLYALAITIGYALAMGRLIEICACYQWSQSSRARSNPTKQGNNDNSEENDNGLYPEAYVACRRDLLGMCGTMVFLVAATIYTGVLYFGNSDRHSKSDPEYAENIPTNATETADDSHRFRWMAESAEHEENQEKEDHLAIWLLLSAIFINLVWWVVVAVSLTHRSVDRKTITVPMNVDYIIHRYGEWIMLMLGESVLSLLVVDVVETNTYYQIFVCGLLSIILIQVLHFESQPSDPDKHAARRSIASGLAYFWTMQAYSFALIVLGTAYKMFLYEVIYANKGNEDDNSNHRHRGLLFLLLGRGSMSQTNRDHYRTLAGGEDTASQYSEGYRQELTAYLFCGSLAVVFFCLDFLSLSHQGWNANFHRCQCAKTSLQKWLGYFLVVARTSIMLFIATLSFYVTVPKTLAIVGLFVIFLQLIIRAVGRYAYLRDSEEAEEIALERTLQYTAARLRDSSMVG
jgi:hypothetical protein